VLALDDTARIGALRFRADAAGPFLAASQDTPLPRGLPLPQLGMTAL
jgi:hypothetical protein